MQKKKTMQRNIDIENGRVVSELMSSVTTQRFLMPRNVGAYAAVFAKVVNDFMSIANNQSTY